MDLKFVYWFAFYDLSSPTVRYRGKYTTDFLRSHYQINSFFITPERNFKSIVRFLSTYLSALVFPKKRSIIVIQSLYSNGFYAKALKFLIKIRKGISVYDMDDADYLRYPPENIYHFIKNCQLVTLGSSELVKNLTKYNSNATLITCPTPDLNIVKEKRNEIFTIGWIGDFQKVHKESMINTFFPALAHLQFNVKLILMGVVKKEEFDFLIEYFKPLTHIHLEMPQNINWLNESDIQQQISDFDIGIATLVDTEFARSKSAFKLKQCFNNGVPVLSSNIAENNLFLDHGKNGFLCETSDDFYQRLIEFKEMSDTEYKTYSANARKAIHRFDLKRFCDDLITLCCAKL